MKSHDIYSFFLIVLPWLISINIIIVCSFSLLYSIPFYELTTIYLFLLLLIDIWVISRFEQRIFVCLLKKIQTHIEDVEKGCEAKCGGITLNYWENLGICWAWVLCHLVVLN